MELLDNEKAKLLLLGFLPICGECKYYARYIVWKDECKASCSLEIKPGKALKYFEPACDKFEATKA